jgi:hypothetical protein
MHFAYTSPLPPADALTAGSALHLAIIGLCFAAAAFLMAFPPRRSTLRTVPTVAPGGPIYDAATRRWRDPVSRRFVKAPYPAAA